MTDAGKSKNTVAWERLFADLDILEGIERDGRFIISADRIRRYREPRLMAKFDHRVNLPRIFSANRLSILPVSRGSYCIAPFDAYKDFDGAGPAPERFSLPSFIQTINPAAITAESVAVNCAAAAGIFADFAGEALVPTVSGRMGSGTFDCTVSSLKDGKPIPLLVTNAQIEIDAALEGAESLLLVEAKNDISQDFIVRQLYYPFRTWAARVAKKVRPVFMVYSNGIFHLYEYCFTCPSEYSSIALVQHKRYSVEDTAITPDDIRETADTTSAAPEPELPFPQADNFLRVINLCELLYNEDMDREKVTQEYAFDRRQTSYYTDAGRYLGLIRRERCEGRTVYSLTDEGRRIIELPYRPRQLALCRSIFRHRLFQAVVRDWLRTGAVPAKERIVAHMRQSELYNVSGESTYYRRASTVSGWVYWIASLCGDNRTQL